jgi:hypothetical protein
MVMAVESRSASDAAERRSFEKEFTLRQPPRKNESRLAYVVHLLLG